MNKNELLIGLEIDIQRTDGRIHSAIISSIDKDNQFVSVEWFEKGEAKGKEIEFEEVQKLNPTFLLIDKKKMTKSCEELDVKKMDSIAELSPKKVINNKKSNLINPKFIAKSVNVPVKRTQFDDVKDEPNKVAVPEAKKEAPKKPPNRSKRRLTCVEEIVKIQLKREERRALLKSVKRDPNDIYFEYQNYIQEYRSKHLPKSIDFPGRVCDKNIMVCIRKRPIHSEELDNKEIDIVSVLDCKRLIVHEPKSKVDLTKYVENQMFTFDVVFDETCSNSTVYNYGIQSMIARLFHGQNATCFAYGQTGAGKTYTMNGQSGTQYSAEGISLLSVKEIINIRNEKYCDEDIQIEVAYFEIYNGKVYDLLNRRLKIQILENRGEIQLVGLMTERIESLEDAVDFLTIGNELRTSGQSAINQNSSRSHAIFQIILKKDWKKVISKFSLIDLAGSERANETSSEQRQERMEAADINKSLLALKECIRALGKKESHVPFRGSKLTLVLKDSFVGENSTTCMIAMISPNISSCEHSLNTLRYADRVKSLGRAGDSSTDSYSESASDKVAPEDKVPNTVVEESSITDKIYLEEETILNNHNELIKIKLPQWSRLHKQIYKLSKKVDYNLDSYAEHLEEILNAQISYVTYMKKNVDNLKGFLVDEEAINKRIT